MEIKQGITQGSVLGLLLFLLNRNVLPLNIHGANLVTFADDINVLITDSDLGILQSKINRVTTEIEIWFHKSNLIINTRKMGVMSFHNKQTENLVQPKVIINNMNRNYTTETKFLGIHITETLKWNSHVKALASKLSKISVGGIFCDLTKAYDCINHEILLDKLMFYGVHGKFRSLLESYLKDRYQTVSLGNSHSSNKDSKWLRIKCGIPQGSILGPLLFFIYINDLPSLSRKNSNIVLYADNTTIIYTDSNIADYIVHISSLLTNLNNWFQSNLLNLNFNKTNNVLGIQAQKKTRRDHSAQMRHLYTYNYTHKILRTDNRQHFIMDLPY
jgi:hypothetical protein